MNFRRAVPASLLGVCLATSMLGVLDSPAAALSAPRPCSAGLVALTFDDGPSSAVTAPLLSALASQKVPATFFIVGQRVPGSQELLRRMVRQGHVVANHTYAHEDLTRLSDASIRSTLRRTAGAIRSAGVTPSRLVRPPYGAVTDRVRAVVSGMGLTTVLWDVDSRDWESGTSAQIAARVLGALRPQQSNVVLLHDGVARSGYTLHAVPAIIRGARARGFCFATLGPSGRPIPPVPQVRVSNAAVREKDPGSPVALRFTLMLDRPTSRRVSVGVNTVAGSARVGKDYRAVHRRVVFAAGSVRRTVRVQVRGDRIDEQLERFRLRLGAARGLRIKDAAGTGLIRDDDPRPRLRISDGSIEEPATGSTTITLVVSLDRPRSRPVNARVVTVAGTADESDFVPVDVVVSFPAGRVRAEVPIEILSDILDEPVEAFEVQLRSATGATVLRGTGTVTITAPALPATG